MHSKTNLHHVQFRIQMHWKNNSIDKGAITIHRHLPPNSQDIVCLKLESTYLNMSPCRTEVFTRLRIGQKYIHYRMKKSDSGEGLSIREITMVINKHTS